MGREVEEDLRKVEKVKECDQPVFFMEFLK